MAKIGNELKRSLRMKKLPQMKMIAACVATAVVQLGTGPAHADSAVGVDTALGNALNPPGRSAAPRPLADDSMDTVRRSPTGQLYGIPYDRSEEGHNHTESGWEYSGGVEAGLLNSDASKKSALFRKYKDIKKGPYLDYFELEAYKPDDAGYLQAFGGGAGQRDQFYGFQAGRYNDWKVRLFYNEIVHVFTDTWKSVFNGEGTGDLTTGLPRPTRYVDAATHNGGSTITSGGVTYTFAGAAGSTCTAAAPCWAYGSTIYSNATALAAIRGVAGTPNTAGAIVAGTPQSNQAKAIADKAAATPDSELAITRKKGGVRVDLTLDSFWKGYASYTQEERKGSRPFAMNEGNASFEIAEPIDYTTHDFLTGISYADSLTQANLRATASMFRNNISTLNVQYPMLNSPLPFGVIQTATYDLYPNNDAFNLKGEFARNLPDFFKGRFNASLAWGTMRQNDQLLSPISSAQNADLASAGLTTFTGSTNVGFASGTASVANWNNPSALSQQTAKQRIDTILVDLALNLKPTEDLDTKGFFRYYDMNNQGGYVAYNPLTGQFGRGVADGNNANMDVVVGLKPGATPGTAGSCYIPPGYSSNATTNSCTFGLAGAVANGANIPVYGQPRSTKQLNYGVQGDLALTRISSVNASLEREEFKRDFREREKTWEHKVKLGYVNRGYEFATLRASYENDSRRGSDYRYRTFEDMGTGLPGLDPATQIAKAGTQGYAAFTAYGATAAGLAGLFNRYSYYFRKYDQANRNQEIVNLRLNVMPRSDMDLGVTAQTRYVKYPDSFYGLERDHLNSMTLDLNYQPSMNNTVYAYYSYQAGRKSMTMNSGTALVPVFNTCTAATLAAYGYSACSDNVNGAGGSRPLSDLWTSTAYDRNNVFGLGFQSEIGPTRLGIDYTWTNSRTEISYGFGSTALNGAAATQAAAAAIAGSALPSMNFTQHILSANLLIPIDKRLSVRLFDRYELGKVKDWHYDGVVVGAVANYDTATLLLDSGPQNYHVNVVGVILQYKL